MTVSDMTHGQGPDVTEVVPSNYVFDGTHDRGTKCRPTPHGPPSTSLRYSTFQSIAYMVLINPTLNNQSKTTI
jgi:hypothetical protein